MNKLFVLLAFLFLSLCPVVAQDNPDWAKLESDSKDFSVSVPAGYQVMADKEGYEISRVISRVPFRSRIVKFDEIKRITAYRDGASFLVESYRTNKLDDALAEFYARFKPGTVTNNVELNSFRGQSSALDGPASYTFDLVLGSKDRIYRIFGVSREIKNETLRYFLSSIKLNGGSPFPLGSILDGKVTEQPVLISALRETPFTFEKREGSEKRDSGFAPPPPPRPIRPLTAIPSSVRPSIDDPSRLFIAYRPTPRYTDAARQTRTTGTVMLRVTFGANGAIEKIVEIDGLPNGLTEEAVKVARLMRFLPQETDNKPVTTERTITYSFNVY